MKICFPATQDLGLDSPVSRHFGSAPLFVLVDTASREARAVPNGRVAHEHGACRPLDGLAGEKFEAIVVGGIGSGALEKLRAAGITVLRAGAPTVRGCLDEIARGEKSEVAPADACASHAHEHGPAPQ
ncbi:MAG: NifB/NifX family molybdenum-iron cluster-binding protein [Acidobacteria bacterium]|nr:NifB/NifX family molybdenum-iron cluster-binding protein [Acidobacteriota bacterium]